MAKKTGEIKENSSCCVDWEIIDFPSLSTETKHFYSSHTFEYCDASWNLRIYPNGSSDKSIGWVSLYLNKQSIGTSPLPLVFEISIRDETTGAKCISRTMIQEFKETECVGWARYYLRSKLLEEMSHAARGSKLIISCLLLSEKPAEDVPNNRKIDVPNPLCDNIENPKTIKPKSYQEPSIVYFKDLFLNNSNSDVLIKVKEQEFPAHKGILSSKSSVFEHEIIKNNSDILVIEDFEPDVVRDLLLYIYCGEVKDLTMYNVFDLYAIASKYNIKDLEEKCGKFLMKEEEDNAIVFSSLFSLSVLLFILVVSFLIYLLQC